MYKRLFRIISLVIVLSLALGTVVYAAEPRASAYLISYGSEITRQSDGTLKIEFNVTGMGRMTKIGAEKICLYTSSGSLVETFYYTDEGYENMMSGGTAFYANYITYPVDLSLKYYVVVTFYAGNSTGYDTKEYTSYIY